MKKNIESNNYSLISLNYLRRNEKILEGILKNLINKSENYYNDICNNW